MVLNPDYNSDNEQEWEVLSAGGEEEEQQLMLQEENDPENTESPNTQAAATTTTEENETVVKSKVLPTGKMEEDTSNKETETMPAEPPNVSQPPVEVDDEKKEETEATNISPPPVEVDDEKKEETEPAVLETADRVREVESMETEKTESPDVSQEQTPLLLDDGLPEPSPTIDEDILAALDPSEREGLLEEQQKNHGAN